MKMPTRSAPGVYPNPRPVKLSATQVEAILTCGGSDPATAMRFGVSQVMVTRIRAGKAWKAIYARVIAGQNVSASASSGLARAFDDCFIPEPNSGCWLWLGATDKDGYGVTFPNLPAHRESFERHKGTIPAGACVLHKCDTPQCVNPDHLFLGSNAENTADKVRKGRQACGARNGASKLTASDVTVIRTSPRSLSALARQFGVTPRTISLIRQRKTWTHVEDSPIQRRAAEAGHYVPDPGEMQ